MPGKSIPVTCWQVARDPEAICVKGWGGGTHNLMLPATPHSLPLSGLQHCGQSQGHEPPAGSPLEVQDLVLRSPSLLTASISLVTLPSPCLAPVLPVVTLQLLPQSCCSTSCPSSPALHHTEGSLALRLHGGTSAALSPPACHGGDGRRGLRVWCVLWCCPWRVCHPPAHPPARGTLPARCPSPRPGPGCLLFSFALQRCGRAPRSDLGSRPLPATPAVPGHSRVGAVTALPPVVCPPLLWQGLCLPEQPPVPRAPGAPRGHRQREGRGEGLPARGCPGHLR